MTNETTASQPKSIGDDAQFRALMINVIDANSESYEAYDFCSSKLYAYLDSKLRAPAAQASATIQAAPIYQRREEGGSWTDTTLLGKQAWDEAGWPTRVVVAIQEPVMVAEPVGEAQTSAAVKGELPKLPNPIKQVRALFREDMHWTIPGEDYYTVSQMEEYARAAKLFDSTTSAAPMVADPAGVVHIGFISKANLDLLPFSKGDKYGICPAIMPCETDVSEPVKVFALAATVKAVPSEALEDLILQHRIAIAPEYEGGFHAYIYRDQDQAINAGYGATPREAVDIALAAPLSDKTGEGE